MTQTLNEYDQAALADEPTPPANNGGGQSSFADPVTGKSLRMNDYDMAANSGPDEKPHPPASNEDADIDKMSRTERLEMAGRKLGPSTLGLVTGLAEMGGRGIMAGARAAAHPLQAIDDVGNAWNQAGGAQGVANKAWDVGSGIVKNMAKEAGSATGVNYAAGLEPQYADYITKQLAKDPTEPLLNAATVLPPVGGAAKLAGLTKLGEGIAKAGEIANPMYLPSKAVGKVFGAAANQGAKAEDLQRVADIEAVPGAKASATMASGRMSANEEAQKVHEALVEQNNNAALEYARSMAGTPSSTSATDLVEALDKKVADRFNKASAMFDQAAALPGQLVNPTGGLAPFYNHVRQALASNGVGGGIGVSAIKSLGDLTNSNKILASFEKALTSPPPGGLTGQYLQLLRSSASDAARAADGTDAKVARSIIEGMDHHIVDSAAQGNWVGGDGHQVADAYNQARKFYKSMMDDYTDRAKSNPAVVNTIKKLMASQGRDANGLHVPSGNNYATLQADLASALKKTGAGGDTYDKLKSLLDPADHQVLDDHVRQSVLGTDAGGNLMHPDKMDALIGAQGSAAQRAFTPEEQQKIHAINQSRRLTNASPSKSSHRKAFTSMISHEMGRRGLELLGGLAGHAATSSFPGALLGYGATRLGEAAIKGTADYFAKRAERAGAPRHHLVRRMGKGAVRMTVDPTAMKAVNFINQAQAQRPQRAYGGLLQQQVEAERRHRAAGGVMKPKTEDELCDRLLSLVEKAKKGTQKDTEHLLQAPDEAVVKALHIAQQAI